MTPTICDGFTRDEAEGILEEYHLKNTKKFYPKVKWAKCIKVYDGDTITVAAILPGRDIWKFSVRMHRYDTAEVRTKCEIEKKAAYEARDALKEKCLGKIVELELVDFDKYGRLLCEVLLDGENLNDWMIAEGHGVPYMGGTKEKVDWSSYRQLNCAHFKEGGYDCGEKEHNEEGVVYDHGEMERAGKPQQEAGAEELGLEEAMENLTLDTAEDVAPEAEAEAEDAPEAEGEVEAEEEAEE